MLLASTGPSGTFTTGKWVGNATHFFLQDVSGGLPLTADNTIATVTVYLTGCSSPGDEWATSGNNINNTNTGNVGIGTVNPSFKLEVNGEINATGVRINGAPIPSGAVSSVFGRTGAVVQQNNDYTWAQINKSSSSLADITTRSASDLNAGTVPIGRIGLSGNAGVSTFLRGDNTWGPVTSSQWTSGTNNIHYNSGNVGIGTTSTPSKLTVSDAAPWPVSNLGSFSINASNPVGSGLNLIANSPGGRNFLLISTGASSSPGAGYFGIFDASAGSLDSSYRFVLNSAGNVGIGTLNPAYKLDVAGNVNSSGLCIGGDCKTAWPQVGGGTSQWTTNGSNINNANTGNVGIGTTTPGYPLTVRSNSNIAPLNLIGGTGNIEIWKDASPLPSKAIAFGSAIPGNAASDDIQLSTFNGTTWSSRLTISNSTGNVGIGTNAPTYSLDVLGSTGSPFRVRDNSGWDYIFTSTRTASFGPYPVVSLASGRLIVDSNGPEGDNHTIIRRVVNNLIFNPSDYPPLPGAFVVRQVGGATGLIVDQNTNGNVGIGTSLNVAGNITVGGNINAKYQDVAEWVPSSQKLSPGTVVVLDPEQSNHVMASASAYDTRVAGVVAAQPGLLLGEGGAGKVMVATTGRVKVKVDATRAPIKVGDLLVTSEREGTAIKSMPLYLGGTPIHRPGTLIGKALEPLAKGVGEILILLSLQ